MNYNELSEIINGNKRGTIRTMTYSKPLKTRKGVSDSIMKRTTIQVRFGVDYDNMKSTIEGRANGTLPAVNQGLHPSLKWLDDGNFIQNIKTGGIQLRVANAHGNKTVTEYFMNGLPVKKEDVEPLCLASEFKGNSNTVFNIGIEKIESIK